MKIKKSEIDIILPNYNSEKYIERTIKSVKRQSFKNWRLIIIDDASDFKTKKILHKFQNDKRIKILWVTKNKGAGYCRNLGIKKSFSKFVAFIDSDDIWEKRKLEFQLNFMKKNNYNFSYTYYETFGQKKQKVLAAQKYNFQKFIRDTSIATSTMMLSRRVIRNIHFTNTKICEDYFFKCRVLKRVGHAYCLTKFLTKYRVRENSLQSNKLKNIFWIWKINRNFNKLGIIENFKSIFFISLNSLRKYGFK